MRDGRGKGKEMFFCTCLDIHEENKVRTRLGDLYKTLDQPNEANEHIIELILNTSSWLLRYSR